MNKGIVLIKLISKYKLIIICAMKNYNLNSREKFKPGPGSNQDSSSGRAPS